MVQEAVMLSAEAAYGLQQAVHGSAGAASEGRSGMSLVDRLAALDAELGRSAEGAIARPVADAGQASLAAAAEERRHSQSQMRRGTVDRCSVWPALWGIACTCSACESCCADPVMPRGAPSVTGPSMRLSAQMLSVLRYQPLRPGLSGRASSIAGCAAGATTGSGGGAAGGRTWRWAGARAWTAPSERGCGPGSCARYAAPAPLAADADGTAGRGMGGDGQL
eukprot:5885949-Pleurochrysis_carterae.AAC.2